MRGSSSSSSVTVQPLPSACSKPVTASMGFPNSSSTCSRARPTSSGGDSCFFVSATEAVEELLLQRFVGCLVDLSALERRLGVGQLSADPPRVVELRLGLVDDLVEHPGEPAHGRERKCEQSADQTHQATAGEVRCTKLYGGSGPTSLKWSGGDSRAASSSSRAAIGSTESRSARRAKSNAASSPDGPLETRSMMSGPNPSRTSDASCARRSESPSPTASPSAIPASTDGSARYAARRGPSSAPTSASTDSSYGPFRATSQVVSCRSSSCSISGSASSSNASSPLSSTCPKRAGSTTASTCSCSTTSACA